MKHKIEIEDFINKNSDLFNSEEPKDGHLNRFQSKLQKNNKNIFLKSMKYAAAVILLVSAFFIYDNYNGFSKNEQISDNTNNVNEDFSDINKFYSSQLEVKYSELDAVTCKQGNNQKQNINNDLSELNDEYAKLLSEYKLNPENTKIKNALINNYRMRIDILDMVITTLKNYC